MSRAGAVTVVRPTRTERIGKLVGDVAREMIPACADATSFFLDGVADFVSAPLDESATLLAAHVQRQGAQQLDLQSDVLAQQFNGLHSGVLAAAAQVDVEVPDLLAVRPPVLTAESLAIQQEVMERLKAASPSENRVDLGDLARRMAVDQAQARQAFEHAALALGRHVTDTHSIFSTVRDFIKAADPRVREVASQGLSDLATQARGALKKETEASWTAVALAAAKLAAEGAGLPTVEIAADRRKLIARDAREPEKMIEVAVDAGTGKLEWELHGYHGEGCGPVEEAFLRNLQSNLGAEFTAQNLRRWSTQEAPDSPRRFTDAPAELKRRSQTQDA